MIQFAAKKAELIVGTGLKILYGSNYFPIFNFLIKKYELV